MEVNVIVSEILSNPEHPFWIVFLCVVFGGGFLLFNPGVVDDIIGLLVFLYQGAVAILEWTGEIVEFVFRMLALIASIIITALAVLAIMVLLTHYGLI